MNKYAKGDSAWDTFSKEKIVITKVINTTSPDSPSYEFFLQRDGTKVGVVGEYNLHDTAEDMFEELGGKLASTKNGEFYWFLGDGWVLFDVHNPGVYETNMETFTAVEHMAITQQLIELGGMKE